MVLRSGGGSPQPYAELEQLPRSPRAEHALRMHETSGCTKPRPRARLEPGLHVDRMILADPKASWLTPKASWLTPKGHLGGDEGI